MANDLHIFLSEEEFAQIRSIAKREDRSVSNLARVYIRRALAADSLDDAPISPRKTLDVLLGRSTDTPEPCVTTDDPGQSGGTASAINTTGGTVYLGGGEVIYHPPTKPKEPEVTPRLKAAKGRP